MARNIGNRPCGRCTSPQGVNVTSTKPARSSCARSSLALEAVVAFEAVAVERAVLGVEVGDAQVTAVDEQLREAVEHRLERRDVMEHEDGDDQVEAIVGHRVAGEVEVPTRASVRAPAATLRSITSRIPADASARVTGPTWSRSAWVTRPVPAPYSSIRVDGSSADRVADRGGDPGRPLDVARVVVPGRGPLVEVARGHASECTGGRRDARPGSTGRTCRSLLSTKHAPRRDAGEALTRACRVAWRTQVMEGTDACRTADRWRRTSRASLGVNAHGTRIHVLAEVIE